MEHARAVETPQTSSSPSAKAAPGPRLLAALRLWRAFERDPLGTIERARREWGDVARLNLGVVDLYLVTHAEGARRVLQEHHTNYDKNTFDWRAVRAVSDDGLLVADGPKWLRQRRLMQPAFHRRRIAEFGIAMADRIAVMCREWETAAAAGGHLDLQREFQRVTLDIVTQTLFGADLSARDGEVGEAFTTLNAAAVDVMFSPLGAVAPRLALRTNRRASRAKRRLDAVVSAIIAERRASREKRTDLLALLLDARDEETGEGMDDRQLKSEVLTLMVAGHETTMNALCWAFYLLAKHPAEADRVRDETRGVLGERTPTMDDLPKLPRARMVLDESMRLYPPAWATSRSAIAEDVISGHRIPKGAVVFLSPWMTHRHPDHWDDPERFDPSRFAPDRRDQIPKFAYFPFGGGPRMCIGSTFALTEATLAIAAITSRFHVALDPPDHVPALEPLITLRPRGGVPVRITRR